MNTTALAGNPEDLSFHTSVKATMKSNNWPYAYACGYVSGKDDAIHHRKREVQASDADDYAMGYHLGYTGRAR